MAALEEGADDVEVRSPEGDLLALLQGSGTTVLDMAFSPAGDLLASSGKRTICLWSLAAPSGR